MTEMPMFDDPVPTAPVEQPPKKPRKPMKRRRKAVTLKPPKVPAKKRRKRRTIVPKAVKVPSLAVMFDACAKITDILRELTPKERTAVLESVGHIA